MSTHPRNVLFIIADDWSPIAGCYGNPIIRTPRIDEVAGRGMVFDQAFCTSPSCAVSRACILTGHYSHTHGQYGHCHGIHGFRTHEFMHTTPSVLNEHGYATTCIGKQHFAPASVYPFHERSTFDIHHVNHFPEAAADFWKRHTDKPFYMMAAFSAPHRIGQGYGNEEDQPGVTRQAYDPDEVIVPDFLPDLPETRRDLAAYYTAVSRYDTGVGMVLDELEKAGRADDTLVIVTTDHGMPFPGAKGSSYDTGHRCPLIMYHPGGSQTGKRSDALVNWSDYWPTVLEWCGIDPPEPVAHSCALPGKSMLPILETGDDAGWDETFFSHCFHEVNDYYPYRVLRERRYKYVRNLAHELTTPLPSDLFRSPTWTAVREKNIAMLGLRERKNFEHQAREALFDIQNDPMESRNLIDDPKLADVADRMRKHLMDFRVTTKDPWLEQSFQEGEPGAPDWN